VSRPIRLGLLGLGKIARDQHLPAIARTPGVELVAIASRNARAEGLPAYPDLATMLAGELDLDGVVMCQPPQPRFTAAWAALLAGKHVFLEKPPGATVSEVQALSRLAEAQGVSLFASWHSRYAAGVTPVREWLAGRTLRSATITWKEDVRHWHPGQTWIWEPGGFGVFDPGINALSILTAVVPEPVRVLEARLETPQNCQAPIAAQIRMASAAGCPIAVDLDFLQTGPQTWDIVLTTDTGEAVLKEGGNRLVIDGVEQGLPPEEEYPTMYREFVDLVGEGRSNVDLAPLQIVADAFLCAQNHITHDFHE
jgi:D-galactose 1-dehydrogenase